MYVFTYIYINLCTFTRLCTDAYIHICMYLCMHVYTPARSCIDANIYLHHSAGKLTLNKKLGYTFADAKLMRRKVENTSAFVQKPPVQNELLAEVCMYVCIHVCMFVCAHFVVETPVRNKLLAIYVCMCVWMCVFVHGIPTVHLMRSPQTQGACLHVCIMYVCIMYVCMTVCMCTCAL